MERLDPQRDGSSTDIVQELIDVIRPIVPEVFTEGKVDFEALRETLGEYVDDRPERYSFTWNGKSMARRIAQTPSMGTLRPCPEESVNWDTTQNLFIEGDNLEVLKLLQKSFHKKVKMIYIDPPYNTGRDFIYPDNFRDNIANYMELTGQIDEEGARLSTNAETSGRYHTNWLNMMLPRLKLARNLLRDDGVIFISIDDHEVSRLRQVCDEIFGEENFITTAIWQRVYSPKNSAQYFSEDHDYVVVYAKQAEVWRPTLLPRTPEANARYQNLDDDPRGRWKASDLTARNYYSQGQYEVTGPTGKTFLPTRGMYWRQSLENFKKLDADNRIWWGPKGDSMPAQKRFLSEVKQGIVPQTLWNYKLVGHTQEAKKELLKYVEFENTENVLNSVKPTKLLCHMLKIGTTPETEDIVLDFFAGSGPAGHATILQNREDSGNRRFILVQIPEALPKPEASFKTIADLATSRLRNVAKEITAIAEEESKGQLPGMVEDVPELDLGFKVFKLDSSNIIPWDTDFDDIPKALQNAVENIKDDRTEADVLYELLLKYGLDLAVPIDGREIADKKVYIIGAGALIACLADDISLETVEGIAALKEELQPEVMRVVFKDSGFQNDVVKTNTVQILRQAGIEDVKSL
jgi:adenine-specific DNA-methyltransferase